MKWSPEENAILRELFVSHTPVDEIGRRVGRTEAAVYRRAMTCGLHRPERTEAKRLFGATSLRALDLGARPVGVRAEELELEGYKASDVLCKLVRRGHMFRATLGRRTVRYFTTQAAADRFVAANLAAHLAKQAPLKAKGARAGWGPDDPPIFTPQTKYTYAPPPPAQVFRTGTYSSW